MSYTKGIILKLSNISLFTTMSILSIYLDKTVHKLQAFWVISAIALLLLYSFLKLTKHDTTFSLSSGRIFTFSIRAACNILGMWAWLTAIAEIGPNTSSAISYMTPIFTAVLAVLFCREKIAFQCAVAIILSFCGLCLVLKPTDSEILTFGGIMGLLSALMWASHDIICKIQTRNEHHFTQAFNLFLFSTVLSAPAALWLWHPLSLHDLVLLTIIGSVAAINVVVVFLAYRAAPITVLMPFSYCKFILMAAVTYLLLNETVAPNTALGVIVITAASGYIFYQQYRKRI